MMPMSGSPRIQATPPADRLDVRSAWVDAAKGLCIILVVMMHTALGVGEAMGGEGWLHAVVAFAKPFRIPAFFLLAGLFLARTIAQPWAKFLDRKLLHFVYFYLLWAGIQISLKIGASQGASAALTAMFEALIEPYGTLWFIYLLPIFFVVTKMLRPVPAPLIFAAAMLLEVMHVHTGWTALDEFAARYIWFFAGYALAQMIFQAAGWMRMHSALTAVSALAAGVITALCVVYGVADSRGVSLLLGISGSLGLIAVAVLLTPTAAGACVTISGAQFHCHLSGIFSANGRPAHALAAHRDGACSGNWADQFSGLDHGRISAAGDAKTGTRHASAISVHPAGMGTDQPETAARDESGRIIR